MEYFWKLKPNYLSGVYGSNQNPEILSCKTDIKGGGPKKNPEISMVFCQTPWAWSFFQKKQIDPHFF